MARCQSPEEMDATLVHLALSMDFLSEPNLDLCHKSQNLSMRKNLKFCPNVMRDLGVLSGALLPQPANTCDFQLDFGQENATAPPKSSPNCTQ